MITAEEVADMLGISHGAVYDLAAPKRLVPCALWVSLHQVQARRRLDAYRGLSAHAVSGANCRQGVDANGKAGSVGPLNRFERLGIRTRPKPRR